MAGPTYCVRAPYDERGSRIAQNKTNSRFICIETGEVKALAWNYAGNAITSL